MGPLAQHFCRAGWLLGTELPSHNSLGYLAMTLVLCAYLQFTIESLTPAGKIRRILLRTLFALLAVAVASLLLGYALGRIR